MLGSGSRPCGSGVLGSGSRPCGSGVISAGGCAACFLVIAFSCAGSKFSLFSTIWLWCRRRSSPSLGMFSDLLVSALGLPPCFPGRYMILKLNRDKNPDHLACLRFNSFVVVKYSRFLWSVITLTGDDVPSSSGLHSSKHRTIASSSLSYIS